MSRNNEIVVPREAREKLHLKAGEQFLVLCEEDLIVLIPKPRSFVEKMAGLHREVWEGSDVQAYLNERDRSNLPGGSGAAMITFFGRQDLGSSSRFFHGKRESV